MLSHNRGLTTSVFLYPKSSHKQAKAAISSAFAALRDMAGNVLSDTQSNAVQQAYQNFEANATPENAAAAIQALSRNIDIAMQSGKLTKQQTAQLQAVQAEIAKVVGSDGVADASAGVEADTNTKTVEDGGKGVVDSNAGKRDNMIKRVLETQATDRTDIDAEVVNTQQANDVNQQLKPNYPDPPYTPGTDVIEFVLKSPTKFVRVYDGVNSKKRGPWFMKAEDIKGLTPAQIQNKFALPYTPKYVVDLEIPAGTIIRGGEANALYGCDGTGIQFDAMGNFFYGWSNPRSLE